jgi:hypothetical protein
MNTHPLFTWNFYLFISNPMLLGREIKPKYQSSSPMRPLFFLNGIRRQHTIVDRREKTIRKSQNAGVLT